MVTISFDLGSVVATIKADTSDFKKGLDEAKSGINKFSNSATDGLKAVRNASVLATGAIMAVGAISLNLANTAGKYESVRDAFTGMTKDMGISVDDFQDRVASASKDTIDDLTILTNANKALALIGKESFQNFGNDFAEMAELSKKAARATGMDVDFMFESLVTGIARESKLILDNLGVTVDITAAKDLYAQSLGKTSEQLTQTESKTAVLNAVMDTLRTNYADVAVSSGGFQGAMQTLTTTITNAKIEIGTALIPVLNELVRAITPIIVEYTPKLIALIQEAILWFQNLNPMIQKTIMVFVALIPVIATVTTTILILMPVILALTNPIALVIIAVVALAAAFAVNFKEIKAQTLALFELINQKFNQMVDFLRSTGNRIKDAIVSPFEQAYNKVKDIANKIKDLADLTKRHSPSVIDIINRGVFLANRAFSKLEVPAITGISASSGQVSSGMAQSGSNYGNIVINLDGAIVGDIRGASEIAEKIGDSIIQKLQGNIRF